MKCMNEHCDYYNDSSLFNCRIFNKACVASSTFLNRNINQTTKEQDMKDKDFRVGDNVTCFLWGRGVVTKIDSYVEPFSVEVNFGPPLESTLYTADGRITRDCRPTLFHGHNVTFEVRGEEPPKRTVKKWGNLYPDGEGGFVVASLHDSPERAKFAALNNPVATAVEMEIPEDEV